jgi:hypothetical protein
MFGLRIEKPGFNVERSLNFVDSQFDSNIGGYRSVVNGPVTLYGTCYALLAKYYLGINEKLNINTINFITSCQLETGEFIGPELKGFNTPKDEIHNREHLIHHLTCAVIPVCQQFGIPIPYTLTFAHKYCDLHYLRKWLDARDFKHAWTEGNNIFFIGQFLIYLRDIEKLPEADTALKFWYSWLEQKIDPLTSLWGTNGFCISKHAVYGGYHQLLVYYHENYPIRNPKGLIDTVLDLQHDDGGFNPSGNAGACEDVDSVDILVNMYKRFDYRRGDIRFALRRCLKHILLTQNVDGGFPYNLNKSQSHMGIPGTQASANVSCMFPTWFRIHTLALISEILPEEKSLKECNFRFSEYFSMGWHEDPPKWSYTLSPTDKVNETAAMIKHRMISSTSKVRRLNRRILRRIGIIR